MLRRLFTSQSGRSMHGFQGRRRCLIRPIGCCALPIGLSFLAGAGRVGTCTAASCGPRRGSGLRRLMVCGGLACVGGRGSFTSFTGSARWSHLVPAKRAGLSQYQQVARVVISPGRKPREINHLRNLISPPKVDIILNTKRYHNAPHFLPSQASPRP